VSGAQKSLKLFAAFTLIRWLFGIRSDKLSTSEYLGRFPFILVTMLKRRSIIALFNPGFTRFLP